MIIACRAGFDVTAHGSPTQHGGQALGRGILELTLSVFIAYFVYRDGEAMTRRLLSTVVRIFGEKGRHARSAFGVAQIPLGACVEIELIAQVA